MIDIYTYCMYIALALMVVCILYKMKYIFKFKGREDFFTSVVQNNNTEILKLKKSQIKKSLRVKYFSPFTFSGFLFVFGFMGMQTINNDIDFIPSLVISILLGISSLVIFAIVDYGFGLIVKKDAIFSANTVGLYALVYKDVLARRKSIGKVRLSINSIVTEFDAVTNDEVSLTKETKVKIVNSLSDTCVVVQKA